LIDRKLLFHSAAENWRRSALESLPERWANLSC
jgi:hypothetical protein